MAILSVRPALSILGVGITNRCNLTCSYCSRSSAPWDHTDLPLDLIEQLLTDAVAVAPSGLTVALTGGEPILHPQFASVLAIVRRFSVTLSLNSNGLLLDPGTSRRCIDGGVRSFSVSVDGAPSTYRRSEGDTRTIDKIMENLRGIIDGGGRVYTSCTVTRDNVEDLDELVCVARSLGAKGISLSRVYPIGRALWNRDALFLGWTRFKEASVRARTHSTADFTVDIEDNSLRHLWDPDYATLARQRYADSGGTTWSGGAAAVTMAHVDASGRVLPDPFLACPAGNIHEDNFARIWRDSKVMRDLRRRDRLEGACRTCEDKFICGGSRARAFGTYGSYFAEDPYCPRSRGAGEALPFMETLPLVPVSRLDRRPSRRRSDERE